MAGTEDRQTRGGWPSCDGDRIAVESPADTVTHKV